MNIESYILLTNNPLIFTDGTNTVKIKLPNANKLFTIGDQLTLQGFNFYTISYKFLNLYFENGTNKVILDLLPNYITNIPYYNVLIEISGVTNNGNYYFYTVYGERKDIPKLTVEF